MFYLIFISLTKYLIETAVELH